MNIQEQLLFVESVDIDIIRNMIKDFKNVNYVDVASFSMIGNCDYIVIYKTAFTNGFEEKRFSKNYISLFINNY